MNLFLNNVIAHAFSNFFSEVIFKIVDGVNGLFLRLLME